MPISVQKKDETEAQALYQDILTKIKSSTPEIIELTCDKQEDKKMAILSDQITGVIISQRDGANTGSKVPGFFAALQEK